MTVETMPSGAVVARIVGELDLATTPRVEEALPQEAPRVVVDLSGCTFLDSSGVRLLSRLTATAGERGDRLELVAIDPGILRILEITGLTTTLDIHSSLEDVAY